MYPFKNNHFFPWKILLECQDRSFHTSNANFIRLAKKSKQHASPKSKKQHHNSSLYDTYEIYPNVLGNDDIMKQYYQPSRRNAKLHVSSDPNESFYYSKSMNNMNSNDFSDGNPYNSPKLKKKKISFDEEDDTFFDDYEIHQRAKPNKMINRKIQNDIDNRNNEFLDEFLDTLEDPAIEDEFIDFEITLDDLQYGRRRPILNSDRRVYKKMIFELSQNEDYRARGLQEGLLQEQLEESFKEFSQYFLDHLLPMAKVQDTLNSCRAPRKLLFKLYKDFLSEKYGDAAENRVRIEELAYLTEPHLWYPEARKLKRKVIMHLGPTNSGKTHRAFERFSQAKSGYYLAPLRLLATEGYVKMKDRGLKCSLITGDYKIIDEEATHQASTVEMCSTSEEVDVVVLDEIQMIGSEDRGWAWTRALLGVRAKEIHLCGEERSLPLVKQLCALTGDELEVNHYERLTKLVVQDQPLGQDYIDQLEKGDCVVAFSRRELYAIKNKIELSTNYKCAVVYGGLPPETRISQAQMFNRSRDATPQLDNNGNELQSADIMVATDAIGYGLNLNIRRIIFSKTTKFDGTEQRPLTITETRQIGGRAGRFSSEWSEGHVVGIKKTDTIHIKEAFSQPMPDIETAGLLPTQAQLYRFNMELGHEVPFHTALTVFRALSKTDSLYHMCSFDDQITIAKIIKNSSLSFPERYIFTMAPFPTDDPMAQSVVEKYAELHASGEQVPPIVELPNHPKTVEQIQQLETAYKVLEAYNWLSYQFVTTFTYQEQVNLMQAKAREMIEQVLLDSEVYENYLKQQVQRKSWKQKRREEEREIEMQLLDRIRKQKKNQRSYLEDFY